MKKKLWLVIAGIALVIAAVIVIWQVVLPKGDQDGLLEIRFIPFSEAGNQHEADWLISGKADMVPRVGNLADVEKLKKTPDVTVISSEKGSQMSCVFFNLRRSPGNNLDFRRSVARLVNRPFICGKCQNDLVLASDTFVPPLSDDWTNESATAPAFDSVEARKILDAGGFVFDKTAGSRTDPKTGQSIHLKILTPLKGVDAVSWDIGYTVCYYLNSIGVKADHVALPDSLYLKQAMLTRDFDILVQRIILSPMPYGLYPLLHSNRDQDWTQAFPGIRDDVLDSELETLWTGIDRESNMQAAIDIQARLAELLPYVPVCLTPAYSAAGDRCKGIMSLPGSGAMNTMTFESIQLNGDDEGTPLIVTVPGRMTTLNPLTADAAEWDILKLLYLPLICFDDKTMQEQAVLAETWGTELWTTPDQKDGMKVTFRLRDGLTWQDGAPLTAEDIRFCTEVLKANPMPAFSVISKIDHVDVNDGREVVIYLTERGYRLVGDLAWLTFLPAHIWEDIDDYQSFKPWEKTNPLNSELTCLVGHSTLVYQAGNLADGVSLVRKQK